MTPSNVSPVVTNRQSAMSSLRASATIIVLRVPARLSAVRAWYHRASALSLLKPQKAPGELDHATADPGVAGPLFSPGAGLASPCSRRFAPLSSGEPVRPA